MVRKILHQFDVNTRPWERGINKIDRRLEQFQRRSSKHLDKFDQRFERSARVIKTFGIGIASALSVRAVQNYADAWVNVTNKMDRMGVVGEAAQNKMVKAALRSRADLSGFVSFIQRTTEATGDSIELNTRRAETLLKTFASFGTSKAEIRAAMGQLTQAIGSGVLSGDEFRTIRETAPALLEPLAKAAGVARSALKALAESQGLTTDIVLKALDQMAKKADTDFGKMVISVSAATEVLSTGMTVFIGRADEALGASKRVSAAFISMGEFLADNGDIAIDFARALKVATVAVFAIAGSRGVGAFSASLAKNNAAIKNNIAVLKNQRAAHFANLGDLRKKRTADRLSLESNKKQNASKRKLAISGRRLAKTNLMVASASKAALASTIALEQAQAKATVSSRLLTGTMLRLRGVMAFFGGPIGLAFTAIMVGMSLLGDKTASTEQALDKAKEATDQAGKALDQYATAAILAAAEQKNLKGEIKKTTTELLKQGKAATQQALSDATRAQTRVKKSLEKNASRVSRSYQGYRLRGNNPVPLSKFHVFNSNISKKYLEALNKLRTGDGNIAAISAFLTDIQAVGPKVEAHILSISDAIKKLNNGEIFDKKNIEVMREYAAETGLFTESLRALDKAIEAGNPDELILALKRIQQELEGAKRAGISFREESSKPLQDLIVAFLAGTSTIEQLTEALTGPLSEVDKIIDSVEKLNKAFSKLPKEIQTTVTSLSSVTDAKVGAASLLREFEGFKAKAYNDPLTDKNGKQVGEDIYRAGYGSNTITHADNTTSEIIKGMRVSAEDANRDLARRIADFEKVIIKQIGQERYDSFNPAEQASLISIAYNYGRLKGEILDAVRNSSNAGIAQVLSSDKITGQNGGVNKNRRIAEAQVFQTNIGVERAALRQEAEAAKAIADAKLAQLKATKKAELKVLRDAEDVTKKAEDRNNNISKNIITLEAEIAALEREGAALGLSALQAAKLGKEQEILEGFRRDGIILTDKERQKVEALSQSYSLQKISTNELIEASMLLDQVRKDAIDPSEIASEHLDRLRNELEMIGATEKEIKQVYQKMFEDAGGAKSEAQEFADIMGQGAREFAAAFDDGKVSMEKILVLVGQMVGKLLAAKVTDMFKNNGSGGSNKMSDIFKSIFSSLFGGGRAIGGSVKKGSFYKVNENTPNSEYFMAGENGAIVTPSQIKSAMQVKSGGGSVVNYRGGDVVIQGNADKNTVNEIKEMMARNNQELIIHMARSRQEGVA